MLPVVTPRFIPSCTDAALAGLGALARECGSPRADACVGERLGACACAGALRQDRRGGAGRLRPALGADRAGAWQLPHRWRPGSAADAGRGGGALPDLERVFRQLGLPLRRAIEKGVQVGLGTDISGGPISTIWGSGARRRPGVAHAGGWRRPRRAGGTARTEGLAHRHGHRVPSAAPPAVPRRWTCRSGHSR